MPTRAQPIAVKEKTAAAMLDMPPAEFRQLVERGALPPPCQIGEATRWRVADLEAIRDGTKKSYNREFEKILKKTPTSRCLRRPSQPSGKKLNAMSAAPRAADWMLQAVSILWNYAKDKHDWPLGDNPAQGVDKYGSPRGFLAWPDWMLDALAKAPDDVRIAGELIRGTGQRPTASIKML
ncbi:hypothetical protein R3X27_03970 [Tropicimonas sp. TH_r6]|uniref:hypothetical protein n=1 Tax=Tropicimonas sp. TH_r6 TaxID=3082085 RepID=UPI00295357BF|nr:hypothetical protein [Tropicimonas sp. TH_r6]MDV7141834.1 hypothetical protein [Tropicimonas sp. TH_r6]